MPNARKSLSRSPTARTAQPNDDQPEVIVDAELDELPELESGEKERPRKKKKRKRKREIEILGLSLFSFCALVSSVLLLGLAIAACFSTATAQATVIVGAILLLAGWVAFFICRTMANEGTPVPWRLQSSPLAVIIFHVYYGFQDLETYRSAVFLECTGFGLMIFAGIVIAIHKAEPSKKYTPPPKRVAADERKDPPKPPRGMIPVNQPLRIVPPIGNLFERTPRVYLSDLQEIDTVNENGWYGKQGRLGVVGLISVQKKTSPKGISMHPPGSGAEVAYMRFNIGGQAALFKATVALDDSSTPTAGAIFEVLGDGNKLWESAPLEAAGATQECQVEIRQVKVLELRTRSSGSTAGLHTVWLEPRLLHQKDTPDR